MLTASLRRWLTPKRAAVLAMALVLLSGILYWVLHRSPDEAWLEVLKRGALIVCLDPSYPPFEYEDEATGKLTGFDVELAYAIGDYLGLGIEIATVGFDGLYDALKARRCDVVISAIPYDPLLTQDVAYSVAYFDAGVFIVVREEDDSIGGVEDLRGKTVAVEWGSTGDVEARRLQNRLGDITIKPYQSPEEALQAVKSGEADAALADAISAYQFMGREGGVKTVGDPVVSSPYVAAVNIKGRALLAKVDEALLHFRKTGYLYDLAEKYFGVRPEHLWP
ncbi:MAG: hypothetical protein DRI61_10075 [Chloroflexi bacterium]|nr:MAG: hypothetical protein DRI61_10075 [Chloroflexota bacterium]